MSIDKAFLFRFPQGGRTALIMSYDDGSEHDRKLVTIFNDYEMIVWGHSYELMGFMSSDLRKNWTYITQFCRMIRDHGSTWCATTIEVVRYIKASQKLQAVDQHVFNSSAIFVWISVNGSEIEVPPGTRVDLDETISTAAV